MMEQRRFGTTDLICPAIGFGTWEMSTTMYGTIDVQEASRTVGQAIDHGITLFDTAEIYGPFHSEQILAKALGNRRKEIVLVTKVGFAYDEDGKTIGRSSRYEYLIKRTEGCLKRLNTDIIDSHAHPLAGYHTAFSEPMRAMEKLKLDGKIRYYGVSNFTVPMMQECQKHGNVIANQVGYHLYDRRMEREMLPCCQANGIGYMAYGSLGFGLLTGAFTEATTFVDWDWRSKGDEFGLPLFQRDSFRKELRVTAGLKELAARYEKSVAQLAIARVLGIRPLRWRWLACATSKS